MVQNKSSITFIAMAVIAVMLIVGQQTHILQPVNNAVSKVFSPFARFTYWVAGIFSSDSNDKTAEEIKNKLDTLSLENNKLIAEGARITQVEQENQDLRKFLNFFNNNPRVYVMANVIARGQSSSLSQQQTITIDQGEAGGLKPGMPIVDNEGILLGKITEVHEHLSKGCLLFEDSCRLAVALQGQSTTIGVIQSDLSLTLKIDFIPHSQEISENQIIVTSGLEEGMPAGLVIGKINRVIKEGNELWQHALVEPLSNFQNIRVIAVIK
jgi:rod shape-determining protein MreC